MIPRKDKFAESDKGFNFKEIWEYLGRSSPTKISTPEEKSAEEKDVAPTDTLGLNER
jgi:hypothetical protein